MEKIDAVLSYIYSEGFKSVISTRSNNSFNVDMVLIQLAEGITWGEVKGADNIIKDKIELTEIFNRLIDDGYLTKTRKQLTVTAGGISKIIRDFGDVYNLTFNGRVFIEQGGYIGEKKRNDSNARLERYHKGSWRITVCIAIITIVINIWAQYNTKSSKDVESKLEELRQQVEQNRLETLRQDDQIYRTILYKDTLSKIQGNLRR